MEKKICLITGASGGLGRVLCKALFRNGFVIIANFHRSEDAINQLKKECEGIIPYRADVSIIEECMRMADFVKERFQRLDALINNAGITDNRLFIKTEEDLFQKILDVNLKGCFNTIRSFSELLSVNGGHIVNISSSSGIRGKKGQSAYSASKAGLIGLSLTSAKELAPLNIKVNVVVPGYMDTEMGRTSVEGLNDAVRESLLKRLTSPEDVAGFIVSLIQTSSVTGQIFRIDSRI